MTVNYALTGPVATTLSVKPSRGPAAIVARANARGGINTLTWNRSLGKKPAKTDIYTLTVTATTGGRKATSSLTVRLGGPRQATAARAPVIIGYGAPYPEVVTLTVTPSHGRGVIVACASAHAGINHLTWNHKLHGKPTKPGTYKLTITTHHGRNTRTTLAINLR